MKEFIHFDLCYEVKSYKIVNGVREIDECHLVSVNGHPVTEKVSPDRPVDLTKYPHTQHGGNCCDQKSA